jgi:hypothetical protein
LRTHRWKRRDLLRHAALSALVAPVAHYWSDLAEAQEKKTYMILIWLPNGKCREHVYTTGTPGGAWDFGAPYAALREFKDDAIAFTEYTTEDFCAKHYEGENRGHHAVALAMFSGEYPTPFAAESRGRAPSIDQIVAFDYRQRGIAPSPLRASLNARMPQVTETHSKGIFFQTPGDYALGKTYTNGMEPTNDLQDPLTAFKQMFGDFMLGGESTSFDKLWKNGKSLLDAPYSELQSVQSTLPADGRVILDVHLQRLRELEQSFASLSVDPSVKPPTAPAAIDPKAENWNQIFSQWAELIDASLRADRTRIVSFLFGKVAARVRVPSANLPIVTTDQSGDDHHSHSHVGGPNVEVFLRFYNENIAKLLRLLKGSSPDQNLLRNSVVMVGTEAGHLHAGYEVPVTLFGQGGGYFKTGQLVQMGRGVENYHKHIGTLHALCQSMGTQIPNIGHPAPEYQRGPWPELLV